MGAPGIALATSIVMAVNFLLFSLFLKRYVPVLSKPLGFESLKIFLASVPIGIICLISRPLFSGSSASTLSAFASLLLRLGLIGLAGLAAFLLTCALLKVTSLTFARDYLLATVGRFLKKRQA